MTHFFAPLALAAAAVLQLVNAEYKTYTVRVRNLTYMQPFSPILVVAHSRGEGKAPSEALKLMAETGDVSALLETAEEDSVASYICGAVVADEVLFPGKTWRGDMEVDLDACEVAPRFSLVGMLVNTNDAFVGIDTETLVENGVSKSYPPAFDAGTEENNELCAYIPGPACASDPDNMETEDGEGYVHVHRGIHGIGNISEEIFDWRNPVAEVVVFSF